MSFHVQPQPFPSRPSKNTLRVTAGGCVGCRHGHRPIQDAYPHRRGLPAAEPYRWLLPPEARIQTSRNLGKRLSTGLFSIHCKAPFGFVYRSGAIVTGISSVFARLGNQADQTTHSSVTLAGHSGSSVVPACSGQSDMSSYFIISVRRVLLLGELSVTNSPGKLTT